ncbi:alpha/beta hydrolase [Roseomonas sp. OT10]|uniref:alpha/beta fold hydrolase n=1 Tax=Roseomonas cutis TaxID=2897332 RepID=UPI001E51CFC8|nr:alpha/beta hydrolase [Roseomonas sp. OT10]UFN48476.1 alpha/beta hydrolase [Roseomonas sp. OT10]
MPFVTPTDGTRLHYRDWGRGRPVVFSHAWPLNADAWEAQMMHLSGHGFRCVAHDRRGHGRSDQPWDGNDMDTYADDLAAVMEALDLRDATLVGHCSGGGEVVRYLGRHGSARVVRVVLAGAVTPLLLRTAANPDGVPMAVYDGRRAGILADRAQFLRGFATLFFGAGRCGTAASEGMRDAFCARGLMSGLKAIHDGVAASSETDFTEDLRRLAVPTLIIHGDDDQVVPIGASAQRSAVLIRGALLKVYPGGAHALADTSRAQLNADLLAFARS